MKPLVRLNQFGLVVERDIASPSWPLVGIIGRVAWAFDGSLLRVGLAHPRRIAHKRGAAKAQARTMGAVMTQRQRAKLLRELVDVKERLRKPRPLSEHIRDIKRRDVIERLLEPT